MAIQDIIPKSRLTLRYRTEISGEPQDIELPLRILIAGDFSGAKTKKKRFEERKIVSFNGKNLNDVMEQMKLRLQVQASEEGQYHTIPIKSVDSFLPSKVIASIQKLNELISAKNLLNSLLSSINNSNKFRNAITQLIADPDSLEKLRKTIAPGYQKLCSLPPALVAPTDTLDE